MSIENLIVGLDGGEWSIIKELVDAGAMPNTAGLMQTGYCADLKSTTPPVSPLAWNSIYTGVNPGKHGVYDFNVFKQDYSRQSVSSRDRQSTPFWQILNDHGVSTGLFKLPFCYPVDDVNGFFVSGFPAPRSGTELVSPPEVNEVIDEPTALLERSQSLSEGNLGEFRDHLCALVPAQTDALLSCLEVWDPKAVMTVYEGADRMQHFFWKHMDPSHSRYSPSVFDDAIDRYYRLFDAELGRILDSISEDTNVLLLSDHGFGPLETDINIESWLSERGYLTWQNKTVDRSHNRSLSGRVLLSIWSAIKTVGVADHVRSLLPEQAFATGRGKVAPKKSNYDWEDTTAFFSTISGQSLFINLETHFENGSVPEERYDDVVNELVAELRSLTDPETGDSLLETVARADELYEGWATAEAPDLVLVAADRHAIVGGPSGEFLSPSTQHGIDRSGDHTISGIFIASGPDFTTNGATRGELSVLDILPTLLYLFDCPVPRHVDGSVPEAMLRPESLAERDIEWTERYGRETESIHKWDESEADELEENLRNLGYLE